MLKQSGLEHASVKLYLGQNSAGRKEEVRNIQATSYNIANNRIEESQMDSKAVFRENNKEGTDVVSFAIPNVKVGSIIEYQYILESPFYFKFRRWEFQASIPKLHSEYWTVIPANYNYYVTLRGFQELTDRSSDLILKCISSGNGATADCVRTIYIMKNIPAFREEEYMTAKDNFLSAINFELSEVKHWDGRVDKVTKEWKDADTEMRQDQQFGQQIRKGSDDLEKEIDKVVVGAENPLAKAKKIFDYIKFSYSWNGYYGKYTNDKGIKKAFADKKGNVGDINLSLISALRYAGLDVEPVLLATRENERPIELHPVISDFNYVIAKLNLDGKVYLLDAVDDFLAFGNISEVCYNGKGRVLAEKGSYWMDLRPTDKNRRVIQANLVMSKEGNITGNVSYIHMGYAASDVRREIQELGTEYLKEFKAQHSNLTIDNYEKVVDEDYSKPVIEKFSVEFAGFDSPEASHFLFNPFIMGRVERNPFKSETRKFPVDYGVPFDISVLLNLEYPEGVEITSVPDPLAISIPNGGGRYIYNVQNDGKKLAINSAILIAKPVYNSEEYPYLRELYSRMIQAQSTDIIFQKKK